MGNQQFLKKKDKVKLQINGLTHAGEGEIVKISLHGNKSKEIINLSHPDI